MAPKRAARAAATAPEAPANKRSRAPAAAAPSPYAAAVAEAAAAADNGSTSSRQYFLMKSEPDVFSIADLEARPNQTEPWDGVRSHQAKKVLQSMRVGDHALFYHSNAKPPGAVGIVEIVREAYPDPSQFDPGSKYHDAASTAEAPKWVQVDCKLLRRLRRQISLDELKSHKGPGQPLAGMALFKQSRLSIQAVSPTEWEFVVGLEGQAGPQQEREKKDRTKKVPGQMN